MKNSSNDNHWRLLILMTLAMISWGLAWTNAKIVNQYLNHYNLTFIRFLLGFLTLLPFTFKKIFKIEINFKIFLNILITSILFFLYNIFFFKGTDFGDAGKGGVFVTTTNPLITFILATIISKDITLTQIFNVSLGVLGGLLIMDVFDSGFAALFNIDNKYFIFCSIIWGIMTVIMKYGQDEFDSILYITLCYLLTSIISVFFIDMNDFNFSILTDELFLINLFFVSIGAMSFGTSVYIYSISRIGPIKASVFIFMVPFIAISFASIFLGEVITYNIIAGGTLSLLSIYLINKNN